MRLGAAAVGALVAALIAAAGAGGAVRPSCPRTDYLISSAAPTPRVVRPRPTAVLLCAYNGFDGPRPRHLARSRRYGAGRATQLARRLNALPALPLGTVACPVDEGAEIVAFFQHRRGRADTVVIHTQGCREVRSGGVIRTAMLPPGPPLLSELGRLLR